MAALKKRGLGRGLSALLGGSGTEINFFSPNLPEEKIFRIPLKKLYPGKYQPRQQFAPESLQELADSICKQGIIQPIIARRISAEKYEIIAGERRFRAAKLANLSEAPVILREAADENVAAIALIENIQRENLNPIEEAQALKRLQDEFHLTQTEMGEAIGKSRVAVTHLLRLLELDPAVQKHLQNGKIDRGHAKALVSLSLSHQAKAADIIAAKNLSVRDTERLVLKLSYNNSPALNTSKSLADPDITALERKLSDQLGMSVRIAHHKKGQGKLMIYYPNIDSLDRILHKLKS